MVDFTKPLIGQGATPGVEETTEEELLFSEAEVQPDPANTLLEPEQSSEFFQEAQPTFDPAHAAELAAKYHYGLGDKSPGVRSLTQLVQNPAMLESEKDRQYRLRKIEDTEIKGQLIEDLSRSAAEQGRKLTRQEKEAIAGLSSRDIDILQQRGPEAFIEKLYGERVATIPSTIKQEGEPDYNFIDHFGNFVATSEVIRKRVMQTMEKAKGTSPLSYVGQFALEGFVPFYSWIQTQNRITEAPTLAALPGSNRLEQIQYLYSLPPDEAARVINKALTELEANNIVSAQQFAAALLSYSNSDALMENILVAGGDITTFLPIGAIGKAGRATRAVQSPIKKPHLTYKEFKDLQKAVTSNDPKAHLVFDAAGDSQTAAALKVMETLAERAGATPQGRLSWSNLIDSVPNLANPFIQLMGPGMNLSRKLATEIVEGITTNNAQIFRQLFLDPTTTNYGLSPQTARIAAEDAVEKLRITTRAPEDAILEYTLRMPEETLGRTHEVSIYMGSRTLAPFSSEKAAANYARDIYHLNDFNVVKRGEAYSIEVTRPLDFTTDAVRNNIVIETQANATDLGNLVARSLINIRSGEDIMPVAVMDEMKRAAYGSSQLAQYISQVAKDIGKVKGQSKKDFLSFLKWQQLKKNPDSPEEYGRFSTTIPQFEQDWMSKHQRLPTVEETRAYFTYKNLNDIHYMFTNIGLYADKSRAGYLEFAFGDAVRVEGRIRDRLPTIADEEADIMVLDQTGNSFTYSSHRPKLPVGDAKLAGEARARELLDQKGYTLIELSDIGRDQLAKSQEFGDLLRRRFVNFVIVKHPGTSPLSWQQIPYRPGVHNVYPTGHYISQARIFEREGGRTAVYTGDQTLFHVANPKQGKEFLSRLEQARQLLRDSVIPRKNAPTVTSKSVKRKRVLHKNEADVKKFVEDNLPISYKDFRKMFIGRKAKYDINTPFMMRATDQRLIDANRLDGIKNGKLIDYANSEYNGYRGQVNTEFAQKRGRRIFSIMEKGTDDNPEFGLKMTALVDPIQSLDLSLRRVANNRYMEDLKVTAAERFIAEFKDILLDDVSAQRVDPFYQAIHGAYKDNLKGEQLQLKRYAEAYRGRLKQFMGIKSDTHHYYDYVAQKLLNGVAPEMATGWRKKMYDVMTIGDPANKFKAMAFHPYIGLFNPVQLLLQAQTTAHIMGILGPVNGMRAIGSSMLHRIIAHQADDKLVEHAGNLMKIMGWGSKEEFIESTRALQRSGFGNVGREVATREQHLDGRIINTRFGEVLDHGLMFFKKGEEFVRYAAWHGAYQEWRRANPTKKLTDVDIADIVRRADLMNVNMSQASNASWQKGLISIPTQFWSYQTRLTEQLLGKRLTAAEKIGVLSTYSLLYGVPIAGSAATGYPIHETWKEYMITNGIDIEDNIPAKILNEGMTGIISEILLGERTTYNERYGPSGNPFLRDIFTGEKTAVELVFGASGGFVSKTAVSMAPFLKYLIDAIDPNNEAVRPTTRDVMNVLGNVSSLKIADKWLIAATTGKYLTNKGDVIDSGNDGWKAYVMGTLGIQPKRIDDVWTMMRVDRTQRKLQRDLRQEIFKRMRMILETDDPEKIAQLQREVNVLNSNPLWTEEQTIDNMRRFLRENTTLLERTYGRLKKLPGSQDYIEQLENRRRNEP